MDEIKAKRLSEMLQAMSTPQVIKNKRGGSLVKLTPKKRFSFFRRLSRLFVLIQLDLFVFQCFRRDMKTFSS